MIPEREGLSEELWVALKFSISFTILPIKTQYSLQGRILKEIFGIYEAEGEKYFEEYKTLLWERFTRVNWIWVKNPRFPFTKWNTIKKEMRGKLDPVKQVSGQVLMEALTKKFADQHKAKYHPGWAKNPMGGWMRAPNA